MYVPPGNYDAYFRMEALLAKWINGLESQENFQKEIKVDKLGLTQKVKLDATTINQLEK